MGAILRQKLAATPAVADETRGLTPLWDGFGRLVTRRLEAENLGTVLVAGVDTRRVLFEDYRARFEDAEAIFTMGSKSSPVACIGHVSRPLAGMIVNGKLGDETQAGEDYEPSTLDLLLLQPIMTEIFDGFVRACSGLDKQNPFLGASYQGSMTRLSAVELDDQRMAMLSLTFNLTFGTDRKADITFLMPYQPVEKLSTILSNAPSKEEDDPQDPWAPHMLRSALGARVRLMAIVDSCPMTVAECSRLEIGQVIPLPGTSLNELAIAIKGEHGHVTMATGALGVMKQFKAVKLMSNPSEEFTAGLGEG